MGCGTLDTRLAERLAADKTLTELDRDFNTVRRQHPALVALYRSQRLAMNPTFSEEGRFLRALPHTEAELRCVYGLTDAGPVGETEAVNRTVYEMFERAGAIVHRHRRGYDRLLRLALWTDGELAEVAWDWYRQLLKVDTTAMAHAIRSLPVDDQRRLCHTAVTHASDREVVLRCSLDP